MNFYISESFDKEDIDEIRSSLQYYVKLFHVKFMAICFHEADPGIFHVHIACSSKIDFILLDVADGTVMVKLFHQESCSLFDYINYCSCSGTVEYILSSAPSHDCIKRFELDDDITII